MKRLHLLRIWACASAALLSSPSWCANLYTKQAYCLYIIFIFPQRLKNQLCAEKCYVIQHINDCINTCSSLFEFICFIYIIYSFKGFYELCLKSQDGRWNGKVQILGIKCSKSQDCRVKLGSERIWTWNLVNKS